MKPRIDANKISKSKNVNEKQPTNTMKENDPLWKRWTEEGNIFKVVKPNSKQSKQ